MAEEKNLDALVPDLANAPKIVRKRRAPKHDFKDGKGKVFAHRHDNGGGWVADTAYVAETAKVTRNAQVFDFARVHDSCKVEGASNVFGHAQLYNAARVYSTAHVFGYCVLRNNAQIGAASVVSGAAIVTGQSSISGLVVITQQALVNNSTINGPRKNCVTHISGAAKVNNSTLRGYCRVSGAALVDRGELTHVFVLDNGRVSESTITTMTPNGFYAWLDRGEGQWFNTGGETAQQIVSSIAGMVLMSHYSGPRLLVSTEAMIARCRMGIDMYSYTYTHSSAANPWPVLQLENMDMLLCDQNIRSVDQARSRVHDGRNPFPTATPVIPQQTPYGGPVIPVRGTAPDPSVSRQRRLLRLGE